MSGLAQHNWSKPTKTPWLMVLQVKKNQVDEVMEWESMENTMIYMEIIGNSFGNL
jgi:hypothetical protein